MPVLKSLTEADLGAGDDRHELRGALVPDAPAAGPAEGRGAQPRRLRQLRLRDRAAAHRLGQHHASTGAHMFGIGLRSIGAPRPNHMGASLTSGTRLYVSELLINICGARRSAFKPRSRVTARACTHCEPTHSRAACRGKLHACRQAVGILTATSAALVHSAFACLTDVPHERGRNC